MARILAIRLGKMEKDMSNAALEHNCVRMEYADGKWVVFVTEDGAVTHRVFHYEKHASGFAAGERARLGIAELKITDVAARPPRGPYVRRGR